MVAMSKPHMYLRQPLCWHRMDLSLATLRTVRTVAECRSFTAAAVVLGFTQSAVSRQIAAAEHELGVKLFHRVPRGVRLTDAGRIVLGHVAAALDSLDAAERELAGDSATPARRIRIGAFPAAGVALIPRALAILRRQNRQFDVSTRDGTTPALVRALRAGTLDFAVISSRPPHRAPDQDKPPLRQHTLSEAPLRLAVPAAGRYAGKDTVAIASLEGESWIATRSAKDEPQLGLWPGLPGRPEIRHWAADWLTKLNLVAEGAGVTTIAAELFPSLPQGVAVVAVEGVPEERRRLSVVYRADQPRDAAAVVVEALTLAASRLTAESQELMKA